MTDEEIETVIPEVMPDNEPIPQKLPQKIPDNPLSNIDVHAFEMVFNSESGLDNIKPPNDETMKIIAIAAIVGGAAMVGLGMLLLTEASKNNKPLLSSSGSKIKGDNLLEGK